MSKKFEDFIIKDPSTVFVEAELFTTNNIQYGFVISRLLWFALRLYVKHKLEVPKNSVLAKIFLEIKRAPFSYDYYHETDTHLIFSKVDYLDKTSFLTLEKAKNAKKDQKIPDYVPNKQFAYYEPFAQVGEGESLKEKCSQVLIEVEFQEEAVIFEEKNELYKNTFPFNGDNHIFIMEVVPFQFLGLSFAVVNSRSFYHTEIRRESDSNSDESRSHHSNERVVEVFEYQEKTCLYGIMDDKKYIFIKSSDIPGKDVSFLELLAKKDWVNLFQPETFAAFMTEVKVHKQNWSKMNPEEIHSFLSFGSIVLIKRELAPFENMKSYINTSYYHAGVYLGFDLIIHVYVDDPQHIKQEHEIFVFDQFPNFAKEDTELKEIKIKVPIYTKEEVIMRACEFNKDKYKYSVSENNCEHLAFCLATGFKYSTQLNEFLSKVRAKLVDLLIPAWGSGFGGKKEQKSIIPL